jgi:bifunctional DNA-binding transcriptional regulator/antitoxin component of YhaV-PrlF toxin-antitoxin module
LTVGSFGKIKPAMQTTLSSRGHVVLPPAARRRLRHGRGESLAVDLREGGVLLSAQVRTRRYQLAIHPVSGLPVMAARERPVRKVSAADIARLNAELL